MKYASRFRTRQIDSAPRLAPDPTFPIDPFNTTGTQSIIWMPAQFS